MVNECCAVNWLVHAQVEIAKLTNRRSLLNFFILVSNSSILLFSLSESGGSTAENRSCSVSCLLCSFTGSLRHAKLLVRYTLYRSKANICILQGPVNACYKDIYMCCKMSYKSQDTCVIQHTARICYKIICKL